mgnify:CR=1 FL=1
MPGIGKTTLGMAAAQVRNQPLYIHQCTADTRPEDLLITPVLAESGTAIAHCPTANLYLTSGIMPLGEHLGAGIRIGLGTDVAADTTDAAAADDAAGFLLQPPSKAKAATAHTHVLFKSDS